MAGGRNEPALVCPVARLARPALIRLVTYWQCRHARERARSDSNTGTPTSTLKYRSGLLMLFSLPTLFADEERTGHPFLKDPKDFVFINPDVQSADAVIRPARGT